MHVLLNSYYLTAWGNYGQKSFKVDVWPSKHIAHPWHETIL